MTPFYREAGPRRPFPRYTLPIIIITESQGLWQIKNRPNERFLLNFIYFFFTGTTIFFITFTCTGFFTVILKPFSSNTLFVFASNIFIFTV